MDGMVLKFTPVLVGLVYMPYRCRYHTLLVHLTGFVHNLNLGLCNQEEDDILEASQPLKNLAPLLRLKSPNSYWQLAGVECANYYCIASPVGPY
jgi:hypothetical protein